MRAATENKRFFINQLPRIKDLNTSKETLKPKIKKLTDDIIANFEATIINNDGGIYVGISGAAYALYKLLDFSHENVYSLGKSDKALYSNSMIKYMSVSLINFEEGPDQDVAFYLGNAGVNLIGYIIYNQLSNQESNPIFFRDCLENYLKAMDSAIKLNLKCGSDEMFVGRAGYLSGLYYLQNKCGIQVPEDSINKVLIQMLNVGRKYRTNSSPLMYSYYDTQYIGFAHGFSAILLQMLNYYDILKNIPDGVADVKGSLDYLLSNQWNDGNFAPTVQEIGEGQGQPPSENVELVHWCHGAPGVIYLLAKAFLIFGEEKYLAGAERCGECIWQKGLLKKGPGLCHGIAGNAYAFLLLYRLSQCQQEKWLIRAHQFAHFIFTEEFKNGSRTPDRPYSLYEGTAGTVCFLLDLLQPEKAAFPFLDIF